MATNPTPLGSLGLTFVSLMVLRTYRRRLGGGGPDHGTRGTIFLARLLVACCLFPLFTPQLTTDPIKLCTGTEWLEFDYSP